MNQFSTPAVLMVARGILATIPVWVTPNERGRWYEKEIGFSGPTAYLDPEWLDTHDLTLAEWVDGLLSWRDNLGSN